jgi:hypothetical protein
VSEKHLIESISTSYRNLGKTERVAEIRKLANRSSEDADFIRRNFPDLFEEAFPQRLRGADGCSKLDSPISQVAKPH